MNIRDKSDHLSTTWKTFKKMKQISRKKIQKRYLKSRKNSVP